jgi:hypothetical protein
MHALPPCWAERPPTSQTRQSRFRFRRRATAGEESCGESYLGCSLFLDGDGVQAPGQ